MGGASRSALASPKMYSSAFCKLTGTAKPLTTFWFHTDDVAVMRVEVPSSA